MGRTEYGNAAGQTVMAVTYIRIQISKVTYGAKVVTSKAGGSVK